MTALQLTATSLVILFTRFQFTMTTTTFKHTVAIFLFAILLFNGYCLAWEYTLYMCGELFQVWEMWLSPRSKKPVGSEVGGQDPRPQIGSPVGNQACIVP